MTNREAHEEAAGMQLEDLFFVLNGIDPDAIVDENIQELKITRNEVVNL
jgi:hypothetical protein